MEEKDVLANNLIFYRKRAGLSQLELAGKLGYSNKNISKWETGETTPSIFILQKIANIYGITVDDLLKQNTLQPELAEKDAKAQKTRKLVIKYLLLFLAIAILESAAVTLIFVLSLFPSVRFNKWLVLLYTLPLVCLAFTIFIRCIYKHIDIVSPSLFGWLVATNIFLSLPNVHGIYMIFVVAAAYQFVVICMALIINLKLIDKFATTFRNIKEKIKSKKANKQN